MPLFRIVIQTVTEQHIAFKAASEDEAAAIATDYAAVPHTASLKHKIRTTATKTTVTPLFETMSPD